MRLNHFNIYVGEHKFSDWDLHCYVDPNAVTLSDSRLTRPGRSGPTIVSISEVDIGHAPLTVRHPRSLDLDQARFARRARIRIEASAGAVRSRLYAAKAVRDEHSADDGSIELGVELPDVELLVLARTAGVRILQTEGENFQQSRGPCAPETTYLQSTAVSGRPS